jgi:hypothetical protein
MHVYWRSQLGLPVCRQDVELEPGEDHTDAVLLLKEDLVSHGETYEEPVLALVGGTDAPAR